MDDEPKDSGEVTGDAEQSMTEQEREALSYARQAEYTLFGSKIALQAGQREEIASQYALQAFRLAPCHNRLLALLFNTAELCGKSIFDILIREEIEQALEKPENREATARIVSKTLRSVRKAIIQGKRAVLPSTPAGIMLLEIIAKRDPTPETKVELAVEYVTIGRHLEALQLLKETSEEDPRYAHLYIEHCHFMQRYKELIEYWEKFNPTVKIGIEVMVVEAYIQESTGPNSEEKFVELFNGIPVEKYESLKKAKAIAERHYRSSRSMGVGGVRTTSATNYANALYREANIVRRLEPSVDKTGLPNVEELRQTSRTILREVIDELQNSGLCDTDNNYRKMLVSAKTRYISASVHIKQELPELEQDIAMAEAMLKSRELDITGERPIVENSLGLLMTRKFTITDDRTLLQQAGAVFHRSLKGGWRDFNSYSALMQYYSAQGDLEMVYTIEAYRGLAAILARLIQIDTIGRSQDTIAIGDTGEEDLPRMDTGKNFLDDLIAIKRKGFKALAFLEEYFSPLYKAIKPHTEQYMKHIQALVGSPAEISHRVKKPGSIILKMLKKEPKFSVNSDLVGFRVITETEEEARTLYEKVKEDMEPGKDLKEWKTLDDPTPDGYRSLDITGRSKSCGFLVQVQIRPRKEEEKINASRAHHDY
ncbi:MAG: RelA/SpoT domain-containing protein [Patescibacteria group bacterium]